VDLQSEPTRAELLAEWTRLLEGGHLSFPFSVTRIKRA
jgi:hypothetical protein